MVHNSSAFSSGGHMTIWSDGDLITDLEECLQQCKAHSGTTHKLDMDDWPLEICVVFPQ